jgi:glycosyltransferase involved in cell wall biosynthesis
VTYVYRFPSRESGRRASFEHPQLTHLGWPAFSARSFAARVERQRVAVLVELPLPEFAACARFLRAGGASAIYDCIDEWDSSLGGAWYVRASEDRLLAEADAVAASAQALQRALAQRSGREVALVPNAVDTGLFAAGSIHPRPPELPAAGPVFLYVGSLWGEWFDWEWVVALARARPEATVALVGDYRGQCPDPPPNLKFLGLRPQAEIPGFVAHAAVCLVPFKASRLVEAVSPLKVFEYLAMGRPVAASDMAELRGLPWVERAQDVLGFVRAVERSQAQRPEPAEVALFAEQNSWRARVRQLEGLIAPEGRRLESPSAMG